MLHYFLLPTMMKRLVLVVVGAGLFVLASLVVLQMGVEAGFRAGGAGGCGDFAEAINVSVDGDTIAQMIPSKDSSGVTITKNLRIMGGWSPSVNCQEANQSFTETTDFKAYGFLYDANTRSELNHDNAPVLVVEDINAPGFPNVDKLVIENMLLDGSGSTAQGGGIKGVISDAAELRLDNNLFVDNNVTQNGGGLHLEINNGSHLVIDYSEFEDNTATTNGAGLYIEARGGSTVTLTGGRIFNNRGGSGAGFDIYLYDNSHLIIQNVIISQNNTLTANRDGGGGRVVMDGGRVSIMNSTFSQNTATRNGGGLYIEMDGGEVLIENSEFLNNSAANGGGVYIKSVGSSTSNVTLKRNTFAGGTPNAHSFEQGGTGLLSVSMLESFIHLPGVFNAPTSNVEWARITDISIDADLNYIVDFETNFTPNVSDVHVHFFFDTVSVANAGTQGSGGTWIPYGGGSPFTGYGFDDWTDGPYGAERMCILVADAPSHATRSGTGNCVRLP
ncbi:MAG: right-handed parallel beta-helix repeat-containing protein [Chloroflexota bacterium]